MYLLDALRLLEKSRVLRDAMGDDLIDAFIKLKMSEWAEYTAHLSEWEKKHTFDWLGKPRAGPFHGSVCAIAILLYPKLPKIAGLVKNQLS